jgi:hypothetical protein
MQPRSTGNMPDTCRKGWRSVAAPGACRSRWRPCLSCAAAEAEIEQLGLALADQARQRDGGAHVRQRIVRRFMQQAVGARQMFELEAGLAVFASVGHSMPSGRSA